MTRRSYKRIKTTPMAPAGCHTHRHASRDSYYNSMNISYITYRLKQKPVENCFNIKLKHICVKK